MPVVRTHNRVPTRPTGRRGHAVLAAGSILAAALGLGACGTEKPEGDDAPGERARARAYDHAYTVRGRVVSLPTDDDPLRIRHEPIHGFLNRENELVGMNAMEMEFPRLAEGVSLEGIEPGDAVAFAFEVDWSGGGPAWTVSSLAALDGDPELEIDGVALPRRSDTPRGVTPRLHRYAVRGEIVALPNPDQPGATLQIRHEAIDGFINAAGEMVGMNAMTMPFPEWAEAVPIGELEVGDKVVFTLEVAWASGVPRHRIVALRELPGDSTLVFREAHPPS